MLWIGLRDGGITADLFVRAPSLPLDLALGVGGGVVVALSWQLIARFVGPVGALERELAARIGPLTTSEALGLALLSGVGEELFFRGAMQPSLGLVGTTLLFAIVHSGPSKIYLVWTLFALLGGLGLGSLFEWRQNLMAPIVAHVAVNAIGLGRLSRGSLERF
ncbi:MAG: CPBP family intramembrane glutamic endopeptidase [Acidobacteriota bacterium]